MCSTQGGRSEGSHRTSGAGTRVHPRVHARQRLPAHGARDLQCASSCRRRPRCTCISPTSSASGSSGATRASRARSRWCALPSVAAAAARRSRRRRRAAARRAEHRGVRRRPRASCGAATTTSCCAVEGDSMIERRHLQTATTSWCHPQRHRRERRDRGRAGRRRGHDQALLSAKAAASGCSQRTTSTSPSSSRRRPARRQGRGGAAQAMNVSSARHRARTDARRRRRRGARRRPRRRGRRRASGAARWRAACSPTAGTGRVVVRCADCGCELEGVRARRQGRGRERGSARLRPRSACLRPRGAALSGAARAAPRGGAASCASRSSSSRSPLSSALGVWVAKATGSAQPGRTTWHEPATRSGASPCAHTARARSAAGGLRDRAASTALRRRRTCSRATSLLLPYSRSDVCSTSSRASRAV